MPNITFAVDEDQLRKIKVIAAKHQTSVNALVRDYFGMLTTSGLSETETMNGNLQALFDYSIGKIGRHGAKKYLGVDDRTLSLMLRNAGFPPPRASLDQENSMLEEIKDIHFA